MKQLVILSCIFLINACSLYQQTLSHKKPSEWPRLNLEQQGMHVNAFQKIHAQFLNRNEQLQAAVEISDNRLQVILLSSTGQRLATMTSFNGKTTLKTDIPMPLNLPLKEILESFEQIYSKQTVIELQLTPDKGWSYQLESLSRKFFFNEKIYSEIVYTSANPWNGQITYKNYKHHYQFHIISSLVLQ